jgi:hypothetical protein
MALKTTEHSQSNSGGEPQNNREAKAKCKKGNCLGSHWSPYLKKTMAHTKENCKANMAGEKQQFAQNQPKAKALLVQGLNAVREELTKSGKLDDLAIFEAQVEEINSFVSYSVKNPNETHAFLMDKPRRGETRSMVWKRKAEKKFLLDTGANNTFVNFGMQDSRPSDMDIGTAAGNTKGIATGKIQIHIDGTPKCVLEAVEVIGLSDNLLSVSKLTDLGYEVKFTNSGWMATNAEVPSKNLWGPRKNGLYVLYADILGANSSAFMTKEKHHQRLKVIHEMFGHTSMKKLLELAKLEIVPGLIQQDLEGWADFQCGCCIKAGMKEGKFPKGKATRATRSGEILHVDGKGPLIPIGLGGYRYFLNVIDDFTKKRFLRLCKKKSEYSSCVQEITREVETKTGRKVEIIRSDNELRTYSMNQFCKAGGRKQQFTVPHSPAQNGVAERSIGVTMEMVRRVLFGSGLPLSFWPQAVEYVNFMLDCLPTTSIKEGIPYQLYHNKPPPSQYFLPFGSKVFGFVSVAYRVNKSLGARAIDALYLGPSLDQKGFRLWIPSKKKIFITRTMVRADDSGTITHQYRAEDFCIDYGKGFEQNSAVVELPLDEEASKPPTERVAEREVPSPTSPQAQAVPLSGGWSSFSNPGPANIPLEVNLDAPLQTRAQKRALLAADKKLDRQLTTSALQSYAQLDVPLTIEEARKRPDGNLFEQAMQEKLDGLWSSNTFETLDNGIPQGAKVISSKWVFDIKRHADESIERYKARLVAKGFTQIEGIHFFDTSSPVAQMNSVKLLVSVAAANNMLLHQLDVRQAFLIPALKEKLYLRLKNKDGSQQVLKLKKCLYGLKQSSFEWNKEAVSKLKTLGFIPLLSDPCIFVKRESKKTFYLALYVDDILLACQLQEDMDRIKRQICDIWKCRDMGEASKFLGINMARDMKRGLVHLSQPSLLK